MEPKFARNSWWLIAVALTLAVACSRVSAFLLRFDFVMPESESRHLLFALALDIPIKLAVFYAAVLHRGWSSQLGLPDLRRILYATLIAAAITSVGIFVVYGRSFPRTVYIIDLLLTFLAISGMRVVIRMFLDRRKHLLKSKARRNILIYGAGRAAAALIREIGANPQINYRVVGLIDDDPLKDKEMVLGARVVGKGEDLARIVALFRRRNIRVEQILIAIPSASGKQMRAAVAHCRNAGLCCKTLPAMGDLLADKGLSAQMRDIALEDLLGREPVELDEAGIRTMIQGARVLITGAAGSIGSELCRQVASYQPKRLVLLDHAESHLFHVELELRRDHPDVEICLELADIRNFDRIERIISIHGIQSIFHAAAYKHVPMMEHHVTEAAMNNVLGTWNVATAAVENEVETFVMISSDKAVNPTNVMGATKRAAELVVGSFAAEGKTKFVSVRFGNVLGSNGSVVPIFKTQIAAGGPVTVTHPEVRRYFMTVREAVQLVLQASTMGKGFEVFVLDMGEAVRIVDLARNLIRLAGVVPDKDIEIKFTGLRPGEKLYEELITEGENILPTYHKKIKIFKSAAPSRGMIEQWIDDLRALIDENNAVEIVCHLSRLVPEYVASEFWATSAKSVVSRMAARESSIEPPRTAFRAAV